MRSKRASGVIATLIVVILLAGCATPPKGKVWIHDTRSGDVMEAHLHGCKVNTFWLWPFDWASKCMRRRGYRLHDEGLPRPDQEHAVSTDAADKLMELKRLRDAGAITPEEYEEKRSRYLDDL